MFAKKAFVLVLLLVLGSFVSSGRYVEDSSEQRYEDSEEAGGNKSERDSADEDDKEYDEDGDEQENDEQENEEQENNEQENGNARTDEEADAGEEVVKIRPVQSEDKGGNSEEDDAEFEEADDLNDDRMMDGNEGGMSLAGHEEENVADEGVFESFKKKAEEINKAAPGLSVDTKAAIQDDSRNSDQSLSKDNSDTSNDARRTASQHAAIIKDDVIRRYAEMGEDAYVDPDDDY